MIVKIHELPWIMEEMLPHAVAFVVFLFTAFFDLMAVIGYRE